MNVLYFDERELYSPGLDDMLNDPENTTESVSISKTQLLQGKQITVYVAPKDSPADKHAVSIGVE